MSSGERVKRARKRVGLTQEGVTGGKVTRSLISEIENNKVKLTKQTANIIVKNINKAATEKNIDYCITVEELLKEESDLIEDLIEESLKELKILKMSRSPEFRDKLNEIETMFKHVSEEKKEEIYENVVEYFSDSYEYEDAKTYILKWYNIAASRKESEKLIKIIYKLISIYTKKYEYTQVIKLAKYAERVAELGELKRNEFMKKIYFHSAIAFENIKEYKECIYTLKKLKTMFILNKNEILDIETLLGNCYKKTQQYIKAENLFLNILNLAIQTDYTLMVALAYTNLAELHFEKNNISLSEEYIEKAIKINAGNYDKIAEIYFTAFTIYSYRPNNFDKVKECFNNAMHKINIVKNYKLKSNLINRMLNYCIKEKRQEEVLEVMSMFQTEINSSENAINIYYKVYAFLKSTNNEKADIIFEQGFNLLKSIDNDI